MAGITYQGWAVQSVRYTRTRGWASDATVLVMPVLSMPGLAAPGSLSADLASASGAGQSTTRGDDADGGAVRALPEPGLLRPVGDLTIAVEDRQAGAERVVVVRGLLVVSIEAQRTADGDEPTRMLVVTLADARHLWSRGHVARWSFNRVRADGAAAGDALKPDGKPWTRHEIAAEIASALPGAPRIVTPASWQAVAGPVEFPPFCSPAVALAKLAEDGGLLDPCLRLDGTIELARPGSGRVGYTSSSGGDRANDQPLPDGITLWRGGSGKRAHREVSYPPDWVIVRGRERVATVALDDWEPVLVLEGAGGTARRVLPLVEETVRELTEGRYGLRWLQSLVMLPEVYGVPQGVRPEVARLLRAQAWRMFRLPGAVVQVPAQDGGTVDAPGPNAHLLPLLPRAETVGGRRLPVTVETSRFEVVHSTVDGITNDQARQVADLRTEVERLRSALRDEAIQRGQQDPFAAQRPSFTGALGAEGLRQVRADALLGSSLGTTTRAGLSGEEVQAALDLARAEKRAEAVSPELARALADTRASQRKLADEANGTGKNEALYQIGKRLLDFEDKLRERAGSGFTGALLSPLDELEQLAKDREARSFRFELERELEKILNGLQREEEQTRERRAAGLPASKASERTITRVRNVSREATQLGGELIFEPGVDGGASVYSEELGIVRTSRLAGHVAEQNVPSADATHFVPRPVRVKFGAVRRPQAPGSFSGTRTRGSGAGPLVDALTWSHWAYRRQGKQPRKVPVEAVPPGEAVVVPRDDFPQELLPLEGEGNGAQLELEAEATARAIFEAPAGTEGDDVVIAHAWPVDVDGLVGSVEIATRDSPAPGTGVTTTVRVGVQSVAPDPGRTRVRPPAPRDVRDGARREGLS